MRYGWPWLRMIGSALGLSPGKGYLLCPKRTNPLTGAIIYNIKCGTNGNHLITLWSHFCLNTIMYCYDIIVIVIFSFSLELSRHPTHHPTNSWYSVISIEHRQSSIGQYFVALPSQGEYSRHTNNDGKVKSVSVLHNNHCDKNMGYGRHIQHISLGNTNHYHEI